MALHLDAWLGSDEVALRGAEATRARIVRRSADGVVDHERQAEALGLRLGAMLLDGLTRCGEA